MSDVQTRIGVGFTSSGASTVASDLGSIYRAVREGKKTWQEANKDIREYTREISTLNRSSAAIRATWRADNAALLELGGVMRNISGMGRTLTGIFQTYTLAQIRVADATRDVRNSEEDLLRVQELKQKAIKDLGVESVYAQSLMHQEAQLTERLAQEQRDLVRTQRENIVGYGGMALSALDLGVKLVYLEQHTSSLKALLGESWSLAGSLGAIETTLLGLPTSLLITISFAVGALPATLLSLIELAGGAETPTAMSGLLPEGAGLTKEEMEAGKTYEEAYGDWREDQMGNYLTGAGYYDEKTQPATREAAPRASTEEAGHLRSYGGDQPITVNQTNIIRTADDKTTVDKVADATWRVIGERLR